MWPDVSGHDSEYQYKKRLLLMSDAMERKSYQLLIDVWLQLHQVMDSSVKSGSKVSCKQSFNVHSDFIIFLGGPQ